MPNSKTSGFFKSEGCPFSSELLEFQRNELSKLRSREITAHLNSCEFCSAEVEFYSYFPQDEAVGEPVEIPAPLFELAEALLRNRHLTAGPLNALLSETEMPLAEGVK